MDPKNIRTDNMKLTPDAPRSYQAWPPEYRTAIAELDRRIRLTRSVSGGALAEYNLLKDPKFYPGFTSGKLPLQDVVAAGRIFEEQRRKTGSPQALEARLKTIGTGADPGASSVDRWSSVMRSRAQADAIRTSSIPNIAAFYKKVAQGLGTTEAALRQALPNLSHEQMNFATDPVPNRMALGGAGSGKTDSALLAAFLYKLSQIPAGQRKDYASSTFFGSATKSGAANLTKTFQRVSAVVPEFKMIPRTLHSQTLKDLTTRNKAGQTPLAAMGMGDFHLLGFGNASKIPEDMGQIERQQQKTGNEFLRRVLETHFGKTITDQNKLTRLGSYISQAKTGSSYETAMRKGQADFTAQGKATKKNISDESVLFAYQQALTNKPGWGVTGQTKKFFDLADIPTLGAQAAKAGHLKPFRSYIGDESQDLPEAMLKLVTARTGPMSTLLLAGDMSQKAFAHSTNVPKRFQELLPGQASVHKLTENYRSSPEVVAMMNAILAEQTLSKSGKSPYQTAMRKGPSAGFPKMSVHDSYDDMYKSMSGDIFTHLGITYEKIKANMAEGKPPLTGSARMPQEAPVILNVGWQRKQFMTSMESAFSKELGPEMGKAAVAGSFTQEIPGKDDPRIPVLLTNQARSRGFSGQLSIDATPAGAWDYKGRLRNLYTNLSREQGGGAHIYSSEKGLQGHDSQHHDLHSDPMGEMDLPPGMAPILQRAITNAFEMQGVRAKDFPANLQGFLGDPITRQKATQWEETHSNRDPILVQQFAQTAYEANKYYQASGAGAGAGFMHGPGELEHMHPEELGDNESMGNRSSGPAGMMTIGSYSMGNISAASLAEQKDAMRRQRQVLEASNQIKHLIETGPSAFEGLSGKGTFGLSSLNDPVKMIQDLIEGQGPNIAQSGRDISRYNEMVAGQLGDVAQQLEGRPTDPRLMRQRDALTGEMLPGHEENTVDWAALQHQSNFAPNGIEDYTGGEQTRLAQSLLAHVAGTNKMQIPRVQEAMAPLFENADVQKALIGKAKALGDTGSLAKIKASLANKEQLTDFNRAFASRQEQEEAIQGRIAGIKRLSGGANSPALTSLRNQYSALRKGFLPVQMPGEEQVPLSTHLFRMALGKGATSPYLKTLQSVVKNQQLTLPDAAISAIRSRSNKIGNMRVVNEIEGTHGYPPEWQEAIQVHPGDLDTITKRAPLEGRLLQRLLTTTNEKTGVTRYHPSLGSSQTFGQRQNMPTAQAGLFRKEKAGSPISLAQSRATILGERVFNYRRNLFETGIVDPHSVSYQRHTGPIPGPNMVGTTGEHVGLSTYVARLRSMLTSAPLSEGQREAMGQQYQQVSRLRARLLDQRTAWQDTHTLHLAMRTAYGRGISTANGVDDKISHQFMAPTMNTLRTGGRTLANVQGFSDALESMGGHVAEHGSIRRSQLITLLESMGHDPNAPEFQGLRLLENQGQFQHPQSTLKLSELANLFPENRRNVLAEATRVPIMRGVGLEYQFQGGTKGYTGLSPDQEAMNIPTGQTGTLHPWDKNLQFGAARSTMDYRRTPGERMFTRAEARMYKDADPKYPQEPLFRFRTGGKSYPVRASQLALAPQPDTFSGLIPSSHLDQGGAPALPFSAADLAGAIPPQMAQVLADQRQMTPTYLASAQAYLAAQPTSLPEGVQEQAPGILQIPQHAASLRQVAHLRGMSLSSQGVEAPHIPFANVSSTLQQQERWNRRFGSIREVGDRIDNSNVDPIYRRSSRLTFEQRQAAEVQAMEARMAQPGYAQQASVAHLIPIRTPPPVPSFGQSHMAHVMSGQGLPGMPPDDPGPIHDVPMRDQNRDRARWFRQGNKARGIFPPSDEQRHAIESDADLRIVEGGPGGGKTTTIGNMVGDLVASHKILPSQIMSFSGLKSGVGQLGKTYGRVQDNLPPARENPSFQLPPPSTFHSLAASILFQNEIDPQTREKRFPVLAKMGMERYGDSVLRNYTEDELKAMPVAERDYAENARLGSQTSYLRTILGEQGVPAEKLSKEAIGKHLEFIQKIKKNREGVSSPYALAMKQGAKDIAGQRLTQEGYAHLYEQGINKEGVHDFDDMIHRANQALELQGKDALPPGYHNTRAVVVDEGQDINHPQMNLLHNFANALPEQPKMIVGLDRAQSLLEGMGGIDINQVLDTYKDTFGQAGRTIDHTQLTKNFRSDRSDVAMNNAILSHPSWKNEVHSPFQSLEGLAPGKAAAFEVAHSQPALYQKMFRNMLGKAGVSFDELRANQRAGKSLFEGIDFKAPGRLAPSEVPAIMSMHTQRQMFEKSIDQVLMQELGVSSSQAPALRQQIYRKGAPVAGADQAEKDQAKNQFWGLLHAGSRSHEFREPQVDVTQAGGWDKLGWLRNTFVGASRVSQGGQNTFYGADRPFTKAQAKQYLGGAPLIDAQNGMVMLGGKRIEGNTRTEFEQYKGQVVPHDFSVLLKKQEELLRGGVAQRPAGPPPPIIVPPGAIVAITAQAGSTVTTNAPNASVQASSVSVPPPPTIPTVALGPLAPSSSVNSAQGFQTSIPAYGPNAKVPEKKGGGGGRGGGAGEFNNMSSNVGRTLTRIGYEMQYIGMAFSKLTDEAAIQGSEYRRATTSLSGSGASGTQGYFDFSNQQSGINKLQNQFPMYSKVDLVQALHDLVASTGKDLGTAGNQAGATPILALSALSGVNQTDLIKVFSNILGATTGGYTPKGSADLAGQIAQMYPGGLSDLNVTPTLSALSSALPTLEGSVLGGPSQVPPTLSIFKAALNSGMTAQNLPDVASMLGNLANMGSTPNLQQQNVLNQLFPGQATANPEFQQYQGGLISQRQQIEQTQLQMSGNGTGLSFPQMQIQVAEANITAQSANLHLAEIQQQYGQASFNFNQWMQNQELGPIGADVSRNSYFSFMRNQQRAGYDPTSPETGTTFKSSPVFGLQNAQFYAGIEHQRQDMVLSRSPLLSDALFQENQKYLNLQEAFYHQQLELTNAQRSFERTWQQKLLDAQKNALGTQQKQVALEQQNVKFQEKQLQLQDKYLPLQLANQEATLAATLQFMAGQGPVSGQNVTPEQIMGKLAGIKNDNDLKSMINSMRLSLGDQGTLYKIIKQVQKEGGMDKVLGSHTPGDQALIDQMKKILANGGFTDQINKATAPDALLQLGGTGTSWNAFAQAFVDSKKHWESIAQSLSSIAPVLKDVGDGLKILGPVLVGLGTLLNSVGFIQGITTFVQSLGTTAVSLPATGIIDPAIAAGAGAAGLWTISAASAFMLAVLVPAAEIAIGWNIFDKAAQNNPLSWQAILGLLLPFVGMGEYLRTTWDRRDDFFQWFKDNLGIGPGVTDNKNQEQNKLPPPAADLGLTLLRDLSETSQARPPSIANQQAKQNAAQLASATPVLKAIQEYEAASLRKAQIDSAQMQKNVQDVGTFSIGAMQQFQQNLNATQRSHNEFLQQVEKQTQDSNRQTINDFHGALTNSFGQWSSKFTQGLTSTMQTITGKFGASMAGQLSTLSGSVNNWLKHNTVDSAMLDMGKILKNLFAGIGLAGAVGRGGIAPGGSNGGHIGFSTPNVNADFGRRMSYGWHQGVDFNAAEGTPLRAFNTGRVTGTGFFPWGGEVDMSIGAGLTERYLHLSQIYVRPGMVIPRGGQMGLTGGGTVHSGLGKWSSGSHSHVQIDHGNINAGINPWPIWAATGDYNIRQFYGAAGFGRVGGGGGYAGLTPPSTIGMGRGAIPALHDGALAMHPSLAVVGDSQEAIIPLSKLNAVMSSLTPSLASQAGTGQNKPSLQVQKLVDRLEIHIHNSGGGQLDEQAQDELMTQTLDIFETAIKQLLGRL